LISLDIYGKTQWSSAEIIGRASVPMVDNDGGCIIRDINKITYFGSTGEIYWNFYNNASFDPRMTDNARVIFGTMMGGVFAILPSGMPYASLNFPNIRKPNEGFYKLQYNPAINADRIYAITLYQNPASLDIDDTLVRIYAVDVHHRLQVRFNISWYYEYEDVPQGDPLYILHIAEQIILVAGKSYITAITDDRQNWTPNLKWQQKNIYNISDFVLDLKGNLYAYSVSPLALILQVDIETGDILTKMDPSSWLGIDVVITSVINIVGSFEESVILFGVQAIESMSSFLIAVNLNTYKMLWNVAVNSTINSQFPFVSNEYLNGFAFGTTDGVYFMGWNKTSI